MKKIIVAALSALACSIALAGPAEDAVLKKLEESGAFDAAVERSVERIMKKRQAAQAQKQDDMRKEAAAKAQNTAKPNPAKEHVKGNPKAEVTIIEYSDFECPYCKRFYPTPLQVVNKMGGKVNLVWRQFPLSFHDPAATRGAVATECAAKLGGNDAFWKVTDNVMEQTKTNGAGVPNGDAGLTAIAVKAGLKEAEFKKCLNDPAMTEVVKAQLAEGANSGIMGTPGVLLYNNKTGKVKALAGAVPAEALEAEVKALLD